MLNKVIVYVLLVSALALLFATGVYAHGGDITLIHACVDNKGGIRIVSATTTCTQKESPLDWNIQGPAGLPGPQGPSGGLRVVDSLGNEVGEMVEIGLVVRWNESLNAWIGLNVTKDGFTEGGSQFAYITADCTGTAYVNGNIEGYYPLIEYSYVFGDTVYQPTGRSEIRTFHSAGYPDQSQPCEVNTVFTMISRPLITYPVSEFGLTPPFSLTK